MIPVALAARVASWLPEIIVAGAVLAVIGGAGATGYYLRDRAANAEQAALQAAWDLEREQIKVAGFNEAFRQRTIREDSEREATRKLAAADARSRDLGQRLRDYAEGCAGPVRDPAAPVDPDAAARVAGVTREIGWALAEVVQHCSRDAVRLYELQRWADRVSQPAENGN